MLFDIKVEENEKLVGKVTHYYNNIQVGIVKLEEGVKVGDTLHFKGATTDFKQKIESMQYGHEAIQEAKEGQEVGIKVKERVREEDSVYKEIL